MKIVSNTVVSFQYALHNDDKEVLDASTPEEPLVYLHGIGELIEGLEKALDGRSAGDEFSVTIDPADAYGEELPELIREVHSDEFNGVEVQAGMQLQGKDPEGNFLEIRIDKVEGDQVTVNMNHPLAGQKLHFDIKIDAVREATAEELEHGHAH
mgnify:CR=1 FL=1